MIDAAGGTGGLANTTTADDAAEAARRMAAEAQARAAAERAAQAAEERLRHRLEAADGGTPYRTQAPVMPGVNAGPGAGDPPAPPNQVVPVDPRNGPQSVVDDWATTGGAELGFRNPMVYEEYLSTHAGTLLGVARGITGAPPGPSALAVGTLDAGNQLTAPAVEFLSAQNPGATFRVVGVEQSPTQGGMGVVPGTVLIEMTTAPGSNPRFFAVAPPESDNSIAVYNALVADPAVTAEWQGLTKDRLESAFVTTFENPAQTANSAVSSGAYGIMQEGILNLSPQSQATFYRNLAGQYLIPVEAPPPDSVIVSASVTPGGSTSASVPTQFNYANVDGLADSTALPVPSGLDASTWRATLAAAQAAKPTSMAQLEAALLTPGTNSGMTSAQLADLRTTDPGALPAVFALTAAGPNVTFERNLQFSLSATNSTVSYETTIIHGQERTVAVVTTSVNQLLEGTGRADELGPTYAVKDVPVTLRIPLPPGQTVSADQPAMLQVLNAQLHDLPTADVFLHGYQSTREVWTPEMQTWMNQSEGDTIGIAFAGMGSEGNALGTGLNPETPRQYAFQTMEALDALGLYGKDLNVIGHSMGGAAAMHIGMTVDARGGENPPHLRYVLLAPAVGPDSVPFLTEGFRGWLINTQNDYGSTWGSDPRRWGANAGGFLASGAVVGSLIPGAPGYIQSVHSGFSGKYGFEQLAATSKGLMSQGYPDPAAVQAFLARNQVLVVAAGQDQLVDPHVVERVFGDGVMTVPGNHYAHLGNSIDPHAAGSPALILEAARRTLNAPFVVVPRPGGGGGGGRMYLR